MSHLANSPELLALDALIDKAGSRLVSEVVTRIDVDGHSLPLWCLSMGNRSPDVPAIGFFGGVHGVERIGSQVLIAYLGNLVERLQWDVTLHDLLTRLRLVFIPIVNPGGFLRGTRANPAGVDLMRHAPVEADGDVRWPLGGQRLSPHLPWYRGALGEPLQPEAEAVFKVVRERLLPHRFSLAVDCHSGFGFRDQLWFPYARTQQPLPHLAEAEALRALFNRTYPNHSFYLMEPQCLNYTTHGDLWDFLYDEARQQQPEKLFLPFTLELGSWAWMKKNPRQLLDPLGLFNPLLPHRHERVLRRHVTLFDFLQQACVSHRNWLPQGAGRELHEQAALARWFS
ncbi:MAG: M14 family zinc carboxypeptidase [Pseudomonadota bacterium]